MHKEREDGPAYQTAWQALTGLFDKENQKPKDEDDEEDEDKQKKKKKN